jgi:hypothetical protein
MQKRLQSSMEEIAEQSIDLILAVNREGQVTYQNKAS